MSKTIYLYLKSHNKTGIKYLGKTVQDPFKYSGSGLIWTKMLNKHGDDVTTEILFSSNDKIEFNRVAREISHKLNVVESKEFANICHEEGQGGRTVYTEERNRKISEKLKGRKNIWTKAGHNKNRVSAINTITGENVSVTVEEFNEHDYLIGIGSKNKGKTYKKRRPYNRVNKIVKCPHCNKEGAKNNMTRYHLDNCKFKG